MAVLFVSGNEDVPQRGGDWGHNRGRGGNPGFGGGRPRQERKSFSEDLPNPAPGK